MEISETLDLLMFGAACLFLLSGYPVAFTLAGVALVFAMIGIGLDVFQFRDLLVIPNRIFGTMTNEILIAVPLFIFMGTMLERSKVAEELLENMGRLFGSLRGGLGISVTIVGALLAASTGIVGATVVTMGLLSLPTMLRRGYDPALATGSIAAAGTLGQIIPPSIVLVLLGDQLSNAYQQAQLQMGIFNPKTMSVGDLFAGALIPGFMLVGLYISYQIYRAIIDPDSSPAIPQEESDADLKELYKRTFQALLPPIILIISVLGSILAGIATPTEAAAVGAVGATLLAGYRQEASQRPALGAGLGLVLLLVLVSQVDMRLGRDHITFVEQISIYAAFGLIGLIMWGVARSMAQLHKTSVLSDVARATTKVTAMVFIILIGAALFSTVFRGLGGDDMVHAFLTDMPGGVVGAMLIVMAVMFVLGFFLDFIEITFVVVPIVAPILLMMGVDPIWLGIMMAINLQTSFLTPPFGFALFYLRGVAPSSIRTTQIYRGVAPFIVIQLFALLILALFPELATWLPEVIFGK